MVCKQCGGRFEATDKRRKFCSLACCWQWRREHKAPGQFRKGTAPWNTGTVGVCKPNSGSFEPGIVPTNKLPMGSAQNRTDKAGRKRAWVKVSENGNVYDWTMRAVVVWEKKHGPVPQGSVVHHKDGNTLNDKLSNLQMMTRAEHLNIHRPEFEKRRQRAVSKAVKAHHQRNRLAKSARSPA